MTKNILIAGFGGQGALSIGKNLVEAGLAEGLNVTWAPSYGPEMRGGTANCSVVVSDKMVGSPVFTYSNDLIAMNGPSLDKFAPNVLEGGLIFINSSVVSYTYEREGVKVYYIPSDDIANELGNGKVSNMVMLGAYVGATGIVKPETIEKMIEEIFTGKKAKLVPLNIEAFHRGMDLVK